MSDVFIFCGTFSDGKSDKDQMNTSCQYKLKNLSYFRNLLRFDEISVLENQNTTWQKLYIDINIKISRIIFSYFRR